jgi:hypothetical protein
MDLPRDRADSAMLSFRDTQSVGYFFERIIVYIDLADNVKGFSCCCSVSHRFLRF